MSHKQGILRQRPEDISMGGILGAYWRQSYSQGGSETLQDPHATGHNSLVLRSNSGTHLQHVSMFSTQA
jgi:hypothetical protein